MNIQGERILVFGDSISHHGADGDPEIWDVNLPSNRPSSTPGDLLASMLLENGAQAVRIDANVSRSAINFWTGGAKYQFNSGAALIANDQGFAPTQLVVFLGTNDLGLDPNADAAAFTQIRNSFPNAEAWAIGPPIFADATRNAQAQVVYNTLQNVFGADHVIDSRPLTSTTGRTADGVHFQASSAPGVAANLLNALAASQSVGTGATTPDTAPPDTSGLDTGGPGDTDIDQGGIAASAASLSTGQEFMYGIVIIAALAAIGFAAYTMVKRRLKKAQALGKRRKPRSLIRRPKPYFMI